MPILVQTRPKKRKANPAAVRRDSSRIETLDLLRGAFYAPPKRDSQGSQTLERGCRGQSPLRISSAASFAASPHSVTP